MFSTRQRHPAPAATPTPTPTPAAPGGARATSPDTRVYAWDPPARVPAHPAPDTAPIGFGFIFTAINDAFNNGRRAITDLTTPQSIDYRERYGNKQISVKIWRLVFTHALRVQKTDDGLRDHLLAKSPAIFTKRHDKLTLMGYLIHFGNDTTTTIALDVLLIPPAGVEKLKNEYGDGLDILAVRYSSYATFKRIYEALTVDARLKRDRMGLDILDFACGKLNYANDVPWDKIYLILDDTDTNRKRDILSPRVETSPFARVAAKVSSSSPKIMKVYEKMADIITTGTISPLVAQDMMSTLLRAMSAGTNLFPRVIHSLKAVTNTVLPIFGNMRLTPLMYAFQFGCLAGETGPFYTILNGGNVNFTTVHEIVIVYLDDNDPKQTNEVAWRGNIITCLTELAGSAGVVGAYIVLMEKMFKAATEKAPSAVIHNGQIQYRIRGVK
jgi:hypothetical protein